MENKLKNDYLLIIDGSALLSTQFYGNLPREIIFAKTTEEKEKHFNRIMQTTGGVYTNAVYGFMRVLIKILKEQRPSHLAVAWDVGRNTFRREMYADYKGNRGETLAPLKQQFMLCQEVLKSMNISQFMDDHYEADDFSGTLAKKFENTLPVRIMTKDNDYLQLISDNTNIWMIHTTSKKTEELYQKYNMDQRKLNVPDRTFPFDAQLLKAEFLVGPESITSLKALMGDASDNIKGVPGVGEATAQILIAHYGTIEKLYDEIRELDEDGRKKLSESWKNELGLKRSPISHLLKISETELVGEKAAILSKTLTTIKTDIELNELTLDDLRLNINKEGAEKEFDKLEFKSLKMPEDEWQETESNPFYESADNFPEEAYFSENMRIHEDVDAFSIDSGDVHEKGSEFSKLYLKDIKYTIINNEKDLIDIIDCLINKNKSKKIGLFSHFAFSFFTDCDTIYGVGMTIAKNETYYVSLLNSITVNDFIEEVKKVKEQGICLTCYQLKKVLPYIRDIYADKTLNSAEDYFDVELAAYLIDPLKGSYPLTDLCEEYLYDKLLTREEYLNGMPIASAVLMNPEEAAKAAAYESAVIYYLKERLLYDLEQKGMKSLFYDIEMPLVFTLYDMECRGIRVNRDKLKEYSDNLESSILELEKDIYELTEEEFNINSPKQLGLILFDKMKLPNGKKTKTGYSTSADVLEKIADLHPVVEKILEYRQLAKLKSTYADGLAVYIGDDERIHGTFNQTITATGRLSSTDPNLQNIPVRLELGRKIRKVFIPEDGYVFLDADYSQIELRILAHMSGDKQLIAAYSSDQDIHRITASQVFHVPINEVANEQRSNAKAVNFGIVYGISSFGLGQGLNISRHEAEDYISKYFETYPRVKEFLNELIINGKKQGYVSTLFNRKRPVKDLNHKNYQIRSAEERIAMNSPIQGTAADIIKIAMNKVNERLKKENMKSRLILQIHDELLVEALYEEKEKVKLIMSEEMQKAAMLSIPLEVDVKEGNSWYEAK